MASTLVGKVNIPLEELVGLRTDDEVESFDSLGGKFRLTKFENGTFRAHPWLFSLPQSTLRPSDVAENHSWAETAIFNHVANSN
jgi:hypothetical protein